jgi:DNA-binding NarL/FixJ family response regulator
VSHGAVAPCMDAPHDNATGPIAQKSGGGRRRPLRVVIVEDSDRIRKCLEEALLEIENLTIAGEADTEDQALRLLESFPWDLAILDLQLARELSRVLEVAAGLARAAPAA